MRFIKRLAGRPKSYGEQKQASQSSDIKDRLKLARDSDTNKEILYYLAQSDPSEKVRLAVAKNKSMPPHISPVLALDSSQDVRLALAGRLVDLLPDVSRDQQSQLYAFVVQALGTLALDEVLKIRKALSSTLQDHAFTPPKVASQLARDVEREVSEPILRFCSALPDEDLLDILRSHPAGWVIQAIAARKNVSADVSLAVIETEDRPGGTSLIENQGANLTESILSYIVEKSRQFSEWQKPVAMRKELPRSIARSLAEFVDSSVRDLLLLRADFDPETTEEIATIFRRRIDLATDEAQAPSSKDVVAKAKKEGQLNEDFIADAVGLRNFDLAYAGLAALSKINQNVIHTIFDSRSAKSIVALCWKADLSMRLALQLQKEMGQIRHKDLIFPREGSDYPLSPDELQWQLEFLGIPGKSKA